MLGHFQLGADDLNMTWNDCKPKTEKLVQKCWMA